VLWQGGTSYQGQHYRYQTGRMDLTSAARPVQERIPVWVVGRALRAWLTEHGAGPGFGVVAEGETPAGDPAAAAAVVAPWAGAGCTWWLETRWEMPHDSAERMPEIRERLAAGPPR
jgi:hypothetical protein